MKIEDAMQKKCRKAHCIQKILSKSEITKARQGKDNIPLYDRRSLKVFPLKFFPALPVLSQGEKKVLLLCEWSKVHDC